MIAVAVIAVLALLAYAAIHVAAWAASGEPYMKVAPYKVSDGKTKLSMEDVRALNRMTRAVEELKKERK